MTKKLISLRVTDETDRQMEELTDLLGATRTEVLIYAVERLYREIQQRSATGAKPTLAPLPPNPEPTAAATQPAGTSE